MHNSVIHSNSATHYISFHDQVAIDDSNFSPTIDKIHAGMSTLDRSGVEDQTKDCDNKPTSTRKPGTGGCGAKGIMYN